MDATAENCFLFFDTPALVCLPSHNMSTGRAKSRSGLALRSATEPALRSKFGVLFRCAKSALPRKSGSEVTAGAGAFWLGNGTCTGAAWPCAHYATPKLPSNQTVRVAGF